MTGSSYLRRTPRNRIPIGHRTALAAFVIALPPQAVFVDVPEGIDAVGHHTLVWGVETSGDDDAGNADVIYEVRRAAGPDFADEVVIHEGPGDRAFFSGVPDGTHRHRVRARLVNGSDDAGWGPWSPPVEIVVGRQSLAFAWTLFAIGAVLFAAIAGFIVRNAGSRTA